jgi:Holliday junction resolvase
MSNRNYRKGYRAERQCIQILERKGYICIRSGGSLGPVDIIAFNDEFCILVQVKSENKICDVEKRFKADIEALLKLKTPPNFCKELWVKFPRANFVSLDVETGHKDIEVIL